MRHLITGIVTGILLALPAAAQTASSPAPAASQAQAANDSKPADQTAKPAQTNPAPQGAPAPQAGKDDFMTNFNILGNAVGDGLGVPR